MFAVLVMSPSSIVLCSIPGIYQGPKPPGVPIPFPGLVGLLSNFNKSSQKVFISGFASCLAVGKIPSTVGDQAFSSFGGLVANGQCSKEAEPKMGKLTHLLFEGKEALAQIPMQWFANQIMPGSINPPTQSKVFTRKL